MPVAPGAPGAPGQANRVRQIDVPDLRVSDAPLTDQNVQAFGVNPRGIVQAMDAGANLAFEFAKQEDIAAAKLADSRASDEIRSLLYSPEGGFMGTQAADTVAGYKGVGEALDGILVRATEGMTKGAAERARDAISRRIAQAKGTVDRHTMLQRQVLSDTASQARIASSANDAAANFASEEAVASFLAVGLSEIGLRGDRLGWSPDQLALEKQVYTSTTMKSVIMRRAQSDPIGALEFARKHSKRIMADDMAHIEAVVGAEAKKRQGQNMADGFVADSGPFNMDRYLGRMFGVESSNNPTAQASTSSAGGLAQFIDSTWIQTVRRHAPGVAEGKTNAEILAMKKDSSAEGVAFHKRMARAFTETNIRSLSAGGHPVNNTTVYMAHFFGAGDAKSVLRSMAQNPDRPLSEVVSAASIKANGFLKGMTVKEAYEWAHGKVGGGKSAMRRAAEIKDPEVRDAALSRVSQNEAIAASEARTARRNAQDQLWQFVDGGGDPAVASVELRNAAGLETVRALEAYHAKRIKGQPVETDLELYRDLRLQATSDPQAFLEVDLLSHVDNLSKSDFQRMVELQSQLMQPDRPKSRTDAQSMTTAERAWNAAGIFDGKKGTMQARQYAALQLEFMARLDAMKAEGPVRWHDAYNLATELSAGIEPIEEAPEQVDFSISSLRTAYKNELRAAGIDPNPKSDDDARVVAAFERELSVVVRDYVDRNGVEPSDDYIAATTKSLAAEVELNGAGFFDADTKRVFELTAKDVEKIQSGEVVLSIGGNEVTLAQIAGVRLGLESQGIPATFLNIIGAFVQ